MNNGDLANNTENVP